MRQIKITIDGQTVDLPDSLSAIKLTFALKDRKGIAVNTGSRSEYSFTLPSTKQNDAIFERFWKAQELNPNAQLFKPAQIEVDGLPYFQGKAQLISATAQGVIYDRRGAEYKVAFYGNNIDWVNDLRECKLYELPFSTHTFNNATILSSFIKQYPTDDYSYQPIKLKSWAFPNKIQYSECTPLLSIAAIVDYIFARVGYSVTSNFFSLPFFQRLYMPVLLPNSLAADYSDDYLSIKGEALALEVNVDTDPTILITFAQTQSPSIGANPFTGQEYIVPEDGFYRVRIRGSFFNVTGTIGYELILFNTTVAPFVQILRVGDSSFNAYSTAGEISGEIVVQLTAGDKFGVILLADTTSGSADTDIFIEVFGEIPVKLGSNIDFKYLIPRDWDCLGLLKGISHAFNLTWQTNVIGREIVVEPSDTYLHEDRYPNSKTLEEGFYLDTYNNLTTKIDLEKTAELKSRTDEGETIQLTWQYDGETEDALNELSKDFGLLAAQYSMPTNRFAKGVEIIENPFFAATLTIFDESIKSDTSRNSPQIPIIWNGNYLDDSQSSEAKTDIIPRILYKEPYIDLQNRASIRIDNGLGGFQDVLCPLAYMVNYNDTSGFSMPLSFNNVEVNGLIQIGLMQRMYLNSLKRIEVGKDLEEFLLWDLLSIQNLNFRIKVILQEASFILQEINSYNVLADGSTKTFLLFDAAIEEDDLDKIGGSNISNIIG